MDPLVQEKLHGNGVLFAAAGIVEKHSVTAMSETPKDGQAALRINTVAARGFLKSTPFRVDLRQARKGDKKACQEKVLGTLDESKIMRSN
jgi:hypothetical protein